MDHRIRLDWAEKNRVQLHREVGKFIEEQPYHLHSYDHPNGGKAVCRFIGIRAFPDDWSLRVGDIVHNMRSALDNLAYALAVKHSGEAAADADTTLQFPICDSFDGFHGTPKKRGRKHCIALLSPEAQAAIEGLQRYRGTDPTQWHPVTILRDIANVDKHRHVVLTYAVVGGLQVWVRRSVTDVEWYDSPYRGPIELSTPVLEFPLRPGETTAEMDVDHLTGVDISFAKERPAHGRPFRPFLTAVGDFLRDDVFPKLEEILSRP